jgi:hypothetical protein
MKTAIKKIKTFEEACALLSIDATTALPYPTPENADQENTHAFVMLKIISKALRGDWQPDWNDSDQLKWFPYFQSNGAGFGFSCTIYVDWYSITYVGSRLCFPTSEMAQYAGKTFIDIYNIILK